MTHQKMFETEVVNSKGDARILLNEHEVRNAKRWEAQIKNDLGFNIPITTMTAIMKRVSEQKFFEIAPADYIPVKVGEGAWSDQILKYRSYSTGGDFEEGIVNQQSDNSRTAQVSTGVDSVPLKVINWSKEIGWSLFELQQAALSGNWDVISSKEKSRKQNWDLGIQRMAFLGARSNPNVVGLLTLGGVTSNTVLIQKYISNMTDSEFATLVKGIIGAYRSNSKFTAKPTHFIIPELDYTGLAAPVSETFPNVTKLEYLLKMFQLITMNPNFMILPCAYADQINNADVVGLNKNRYVLLNKDEDTLTMELPVDYTSTVANTLNGMNFQNIGYGQFTGVGLYRAREILYFDWNV